MGDPRRQRPKVVTPSHPWEKARIQEELKSVGEYGLRNKWELWKHKTQLSRFRETVRKLRGLSGEEGKRQLKQIVDRLIRMGLLNPGGHTFDDVLNLSIKDFLDRRLQTQVYKIGLAKTVTQARQFIVHHHIAVDGQIVNSPSYLILGKDEGKIAFAAWSPYANKEHPIYQMMTGAAGTQAQEVIPEIKPTKRPPVRSRKGGRAPKKEEAEEDTTEGTGDLPNEASDSEE
ncbi:MAG: 30S ribosomal protein S4P [Promethearchaeota archaeon CR_4]|nr:MAG: 30S ribosomal protein S4P [Candidatus Lokiarchaeota archaeon CR_4]